MSSNRTTDQILSELSAKDVRLWAEGDRLRLSAPKGALSESLQEELSARKQEILSYLEMAREAGRAVGGERRPIEPVGRTGNLALSFGQERLWFLHQLETESTAYNIPVEIRFRGETDAEALGRAMSAVAQRHEVLRTVFPEFEGRPVAAILPPFEVPLPVQSLIGLGREAAARELERARAENGRVRFDLASSPPWRARLGELAPRDYLLLFTQHHILTDRWSLGLFVRELETLYRGFREKKPTSLPPLAIQYADFAAWQRRELSRGAQRNQLEYWKNELTPPFPIVELPLDAPRPLAQTFSGAWESVLYPGSLLDSLKALGREENATLFMVLLAAFDVLVHRYTGLEDILVGTPTAGRNERETESVMGFFVNTLVLRSDLSGEPSFRDLLRRVRRASLEAFTHRDVPFENVVEEIPLERRLNLNPFFQLMLVLQNTPPVETQEKESSAIQFTATGGSTLDLTLYHVDRDRDLVVTAEYNTDLFERGTIVALLANLKRLLEDAVARPDASISELSILAPSEREKVLFEWNSTDVPYERGLCLHQLFEAQAERTPERTAVVSGENSLTYGELERRANDVAHRLLEAGVGPETLVGVCLPRSCDLVVALLGVLKAGAAYVPLDPAYPDERLAFMLRDSRAKAVLTDPGRELPENEAQVLRLDDGLLSAVGGMDVRPTPGLDPENLAYVLYTSGSTGTPKGVAIAHRSAVALIEWAKGMFGDEELSNAAFTTSICFDLSVFELFLPLSRGGRVVVLEDALAVATSPMAEELTLVNTVPSAMAELTRSGKVPSSVRTICLAGEPLSEKLVREILETTRARRVFDLYGPSEDTTYSTFARRTKGGPQTIGRPIANTRVYVVDETLSPVPRGATGELCLGGDGLARGYFDRPAETAEKFVPDPFSDRPGARLYRTGDLARHRSDGQLEFLGRRDYQVKLRGFRIELAEIEEVLRRHEAVEAAAVLVTGEGADEKLSAFVACGSNAQPTVTELRRYLRAKLPAHMVPSIYVVLDNLPLTPNGKIDRHALRSQDAASSAPAERFLAPRTELERGIASVWMNLLPVARVGVHDNFFDLGGHSLMSIRALAGIEKVTGVRLGVRDLMFQTLEQCAAACEAALGEKVSPPGG